MIITTAEYGPVLLQKISSDNINWPCLQGSETYFCDESFGSIVLQEFKTENYSLRFLLLNLVKKVSLVLKDDMSLLKTAFCLNGSFIQKAIAKKIKLNKGQYLLSGTDRSESSFYFQKQDSHQILESSFSTAMLQNYFNAFPSLKNYIDNSAHVPGDIRSPQFISAETKKIIHDILNCPYDKHLIKLYFENKVNDLLFEILWQSFDASHISSGSQRQTEAVFQAKNIILEDITKHYSIKELAAKVSLSEVNLKAGFKQVFGTGLFEYLIQARMEKAYHLVTQTDIPIKNIAKETGFHYVANFITAFGKRYGKPPTDFRKK